MAEKSQELNEIESMNQCPSLSLHLSARALQQVGGLEPPC